MLLSERIFRILQILLMMICLSLWFEQGYWHTKSVFCCFFSLQLLEELDVLLTLWMDLARLDENACVEDDLADVLLAWSGYRKYRVEHLISLFRLLFSIPILLRANPIKVLTITCCLKLSVVGEFTLLGEVNIVLQEIQFVLVTVSDDWVLVDQKAIISGFNIVTQFLSCIVLNAVLGGLCKLSERVSHLLCDF